MLLIVGYICEKKLSKNYLVKLLEKHMPSQGFKGVETFDSDKVPSLDYEGPLNCWAYPVVTPTTSAVALPNIGKCPIKHFMRSVNEGLSSVRLKNHYLDAKELINIRKAADTIWVGVDLYHKGLGVDIHKMGPQAKGPKQELEELDDIAKKRLTEYSNKNMAGCLKETPSMLPIKVLAANSMYRIGRESRFLPFILSIYIKKM